MTIHTYPTYYFAVPVFLFFIAAFDCESGELSEEPAIASEQVSSASLSIQVKEHPEDQSLRLRLIHAYIGEKDSVSAVSECITLLRHDANCAEAHYLIAKTLRPLRGNSQKCLEHAREAVRLRNDPAYQKELLDTLYSLKHFDEALQLGKSLAKQSGDLSIQYDLAVIYLRMGKREEMRKTIDEILTKNPNYVPALVFRASDSIDYQNYAGALPDVDRALAMKPDHALAHYLRGRIAFAAKDYPRAQTEFEFVVDRDPFHHHALYQLTRAYSALGRKKESEMTEKSMEAVKSIPEDQRERYRSYLQTHPDTAETHWRMGCIYLEIQRGNLAATEFQRVLEIEPAHADALMALAGICMSSQEYEKSLSYLHRAMEYHPNSISVMIASALALHRLHRDEESVGYLEKILRIDPSHEKANELLRQIRR